MGTRTGIQGRAAEALEVMAGLVEPTGAPTPVELDQISGRSLMRLWNGDVAEARADALTMVVETTRRRGPIHANLFASQFLADAQLIGWAIGTRPS